MASTMRNLARNENSPAVVEKSDVKQDESVSQEPISTVEILAHEAVTETPSSPTEPVVGDSSVSEPMTSPVVDTAQEVSAADEKKSEKKSKPKFPPKKGEKVADQKKVKTPSPETDT